jgi:hypothetical protein
MIKNYRNFIKESVANKGKGPGNTDLYPTAHQKQIINSSNPTMDFLRIGKHIKTKDVDGFIDSIQGNNIYIIDSVSGEINKYNLKDFVKGLPKGAKLLKEGIEQKKIQKIQGFYP